MALYAGHFKPIPLRIDEPPAGIDVTSCGAEDGRSATIFAVNTRKKIFVTFFRNVRIYG